MGAYGRSNSSCQVPSPLAPIEAWPAQDTPRSLSARGQQYIEINSDTTEKIDARVGDKTGFIGQLRIAARGRGFNRQHSWLSGEQGE